MSDAIPGGHPWAPYCDVCGGEHYPYCGDERYMEARALGDGRFGVVDEDGDLIGGPFPTLARAERWMETH
jgi:hypothetical protein